MQEDIALPIENDPELIQELVDECSDAFDSIENILLELENNNFDSGKLDNLISNLQSLSAVMRLGGFQLLASFSETIITLLNRSKFGTIDLTEKVVDILVLAVESLHVSVESSFANEFVDENDLLRIKEEIEKLNSCSKDHIHDQIEKVLKTLDFNYGAPPVKLSDALVTKEQNAEAQEIDPDQLTDLDFFKDMVRRIEVCHPELKNRGKYILDIVLAMNNEDGNNIPDVQLEAAVYMHDFGMMFIPGDPLNLSSNLTTEQRKQMQEHPMVGAEILLRMGGWDEAANMVMQHHEWENGGGYPEGIHGDGICEGAKIIAIADTVYAMTHKQVYREEKRPFFRAAAEINSCSGKQFSPYWVDVFNRVFRKKKGSLFKTG